MPVAAISDQAKIKVAWFSDLTIFDTAPDPASAVFDIVPSIEVTLPNGGETWKVDDDSRLVKWNVNGTLSLVDIYYCTNHSAPLASRNYVIINNGGGEDINAAQGVAGYP